MIESSKQGLHSLWNLNQQAARDLNDPRAEGLGYQKRDGETKKPVQSNDKSVKKRVAYATSIQPDTSNKPEESCCLYYCGEGTKHSILVCRKFFLWNQRKRLKCAVIKASASGV